MKHATAPQSRFNSRSPWAKWLLVLVLVSAQGLALAHQAGHSYSTDACSVCAVAQNLGSAATDNPDCETPSPTTTLSGQEQRSALTLPHRRSYWVRAPPTP